MQLKRNKYDFYVILMISILAFGNLGGSLQPIRILTLIFFPYILIELIKNKFSKPERNIIYFFAFWYIYLLLSLLWTSDISGGYKEVFYYFVHFSSFLLIIFFAKKANRPFQSIIYGWCLFFIFTVPIALNEVINDQHLSSSIFEADNVINISQNTIVQKKFASVTFGNYNTYVTILTFIFPFLFAALFFTKKAIGQFFIFSLIGICLFLFLINASRGGIICSVITIIIFLIYYKKNNLKIKNGIFILLLTTIFIAIIYYFDVIFQQLTYRTVAMDSFFEDTGRLDLVQIAFNFISEYKFIGTGVGSMVSILHSDPNLGVFILHNLFLEIFMQFGLIIFSLVLIFLFQFYIKGREIKSNQIKFIVFAILGSLIPSSIINSAYLLLPSLWIFWGSLFVIVTNRKINPI